MKMVYADFSFITLPDCLLFSATTDVLPEVSIVPPLFPVLRTLYLIFVWAMRFVYRLIFWFFPSLNDPSCSIQGVCNNASVQQNTGIVRTAVGNVTVVIPCCFSRIEHPYLQDSSVMLCAPSFEENMRGKRGDIKGWHCSTFLFWDWHAFAPQDWCLHFPDLPWSSELEATLQPSVSACSEFSHRSSASQLQISFFALLHWMNGMVGLVVTVVLIVIAVSLSAYVKRFVTATWHNCVRSYLSRAPWTHNRWTFDYCTV